MYICIVAERKEEGHAQHSTARKKNEEEEKKEK